MRYHFMPVRMAAIQKSTSNKCWIGCGEKGPFLHCWWECKLAQPLVRTVLRFLKKLEMELPSIQFSSVAQSCPTLCDPMDCSLPGSSIYGIFQATVLEWGAIAFSRLLPCPGYYKQCWDEHWSTHVSFNSGFLGMYAQQWDCWVIRQFYFQFFKESPHCSP